MRKLLAIIISVYCFSCNGPQKEKKFEDYPLDIQLKAKKMTDSLIQASTKEALFDTLGLSQAPVKVLSSRLVKQEYSNYKDISLTYKNVSDKKIQAIRFRWYGINAFGEPADMGSSGLLAGFGSGFHDEQIRPGKTQTSEWSIMSRDGKKIVLAWPYEVAFTDGSKWKCGKQ
ncbi:MAG: hypothetical protein JWR61_5644 [Ferruginibacter sp.]|uniref:hypothetical protein n=1 Tax=Ferruginibacter sp. TaxID=1940288 RepID=UPI002659B284|nr:hypothetical protein [Ferruginibacter sp.]MDB5280689.1 hypothetical protein [Ferruginibacter sp.]